MKDNRINYDLERKLRRYAISDLMKYIVIGQGIVFALGYFVIRPAAILIGIADQTFDVVHRREKMEEETPNPFDPRTHDDK